MLRAPCFPMLFAVAATLLLITPLPASGQSWSEREQAVWDVVMASWVEITKGNASWSDDFVHPRAVVWSDQDPMPRTIASVKKWDEHTFAESTTLTYEISPAAIVVEGSTAVAHYHFSLYTQILVGTRAGDNRTVHGRCSDILIDEGGTWKFIAWNCGQEPSEGN